MRTVVKHAIEFVAKIGGDWRAIKLNLIYIDKNER